MKKLLLISLISITLSGIAFAEAECEGGREVIGKNEHVYCQSIKGMNWWSAFAWCKSNNRHLVTLDEACNNKPWVSGCSNLSFGLSTSGGWTAIGVEDNKAYRLNFGVGGVAADPRTYGHSALCY